jgi:hypothetical protein
MLKRVTELVRPKHGSCHGGMREMNGQTGAHARRFKDQPYREDGSLHRDRAWIFGLWVGARRGTRTWGQWGVVSIRGISGSNVPGVPIERATPDKCDISTNPIVLVSRVMSGRTPGVEPRLRTQDDGPSPLPFIDDPCQLRALAKVVTGGFGVNASLAQVSECSSARANE